MLIAIVIISVMLMIGAYFLFRDTMNKIQYLEILRLYWITRDTGEGQPLFAKATMRQTSAPYWRGKGVQVRVGKHTFQVGLLTMRVDSLESQISNIGWLETEPKKLRQWYRVR
jgi:hypothetical protein